MMLFQPFALVVAAACALGLPSIVNGAAMCVWDCERSTRDRNLANVDASLLYPDGKYDKDAQERLAQRRAEENCYCPGLSGNESIIFTETFDECCDECAGEPLARRLLPKSAKTKSSKSPKCKSEKSTSAPGRRLSKRRAIGAVPIAKNRKEESPWSAPAVSGAELLAADPGIWVVPGLLDEELVGKIKVLVNKYGNDLGHYQKCGSVLPEEKKCLKFSPSLIDKDDNELYSEMRAKVQAIWPQLLLRDVVSVTDQKGDIGPTDYHYDGMESFHMPATVVLYLTDSDEGTGGDTVFPLVGEDGIFVTPQKGTALTFLNVHADGQMKEKSLHGAQATTHESSGRTIVSFEFFLSSEEFPEVTGQASSVL